eukprot:CAMPEP_0185017382 /NCGR_PEP_ID=MMETSP1103-20130426/340_1 /TAXON_ID=36769 /ORGANISM="Paraphysomonas bandaiensis, Strain Caron Lab Isolate" /LENGTH=145 /DNA_ID=CAMNT_0027546763 /DNA_START=51 /DNA_END=485 /DNA_ORIENTATION=+
MKTLPSTVKAYKRTSTFTKKTVPKGLLHRHNTKVGTWGLIVVVNGSLNYTIFNDGKTRPDIRILTPGNPGVIEPQVYHKVELRTDDTQFYVEFYANEEKAVMIPGFMKSSTVTDVSTSPKSKFKPSTMFLFRSITYAAIGGFVAW